jgi:soluble lytic murein transglycosylase
MKTLLAIGALVCCHLFLANNSFAKTDSDDAKFVRQRADFIAARNALDNGRLSKYRKLARQLQDYPLYPYLEYWEINRYLSSVTPEKVNAFVERYQEIYLGDRLQRFWLERVARQGRWELFLKYYSPSKADTEMECYYRRALYKTGKKQAAFDGLEKVWLVGKSQPHACDPLFAAWNKAGHLTEALAWQRIVLALDNGQVYLARYLERFLGNEKRGWSRLWRDIHRHPDHLIGNQHLRDDIPVVRSILAHGIRRMALRNPSKAADIWDRLVMDFAFSEEEFTRTESYIAVAMAQKHTPEAMHWLINVDDQDEKVRKWRILTAINQNNWDDAIFWIRQLPPEEQLSMRWRYWLARAYEQTGKSNRARLTYREIAKSRDYYGFLAADHIDSAYDFENHPLRFRPGELADVEKLPGMIRTREFYLMGDLLYARREWYYTTRTLNDTELEKVARVIHDWGWHDRAIMSLGEAGYYDDLEIRFPLAHREQVNSNANAQKLDPSWAYAVIRQESAFAPDARSPKGAMGLMQIMPSTGRLIARDLNTRLKNKLQLLDVDTNIRFGISYLRKVMDRFDQNTVLATAAYNAGTERVKSWLPQEDLDAPDRWIENIPYAETRNYLKQVLSFTAIYDERMQLPVTRLKQRMPMIMPLETPTL